MKITVEENRRTQNNIIIIPKRCVKLACHRNKIRRQIKTILQATETKKKVVKYFDKEQKPLFKEVNKELLKVLSFKC